MMVSDNVYDVYIYMRIYFYTMNRLLNLNKRVKEIEYESYFNSDFYYRAILKFPVTMFFT